MNPARVLARKALTLIAALAARVTSAEATIATHTTALAREVYAVTTSDQTLIGTSYTAVTGLSFALAANTTYEFEFSIIADSDASTTGIDIAVNGPASPTALSYTQAPWNSASALRSSPATAYNNDTGQANSAGTTRALYRVFGTVVNGANAGSLTCTIKREAVGTGPNVRAGSWGRCRCLS